MKGDYTVYPSMIADRAEMVWSYDNPHAVSTFDETHSLNVSISQCHIVSFCRWYVPSLRSLNGSSGTQYALFDEWNRWMAVSQQRFTSIVTDPAKNKAIVTVQGVSSETISISILFCNLSLSIVQYLLQTCKFIL